MTTASSFGPLTLEKILRCWSNETHERSRKHALRRMVETAGLDKRRLGGVGGVVRWGIVSSTVPAVRGLEKMPSDETGGIQIIHLKKKKVSLLRWSGIGTGCPEGFLEVFKRHLDLVLGALG